jgi:uncharacterized cupredoxin-like copper-binding protein
MWTFRRRAWHGLFAALAPILAVASTIGEPASPAKAQKTVNVTMSDTMRFDPAEITVKRGEVVRFVGANAGKLPHEMVLGTKKDLEEHAKHMREHPHMEHHDSNALHLAPGQSGELVWRFTRAGTFYYGCLQPGHFEAGMVGKVVVTER